jgi:hypothetical protein
MVVKPKKNRASGRLHCNNKNILNNVDILKKTRRPWFDSNQVIKLIPSLPIT